MDATPPMTSPDHDPRLAQAQAWLKRLGLDVQSGFKDVAGDASFRRYFRLRINGQTVILMDAPPPAEDTRPFTDVTSRLRAAGLKAPEILQADAVNGFLLLEDLGDNLYRGFLGVDNAHEHFPALLDVLQCMARSVDPAGLPEYDTRLLRFEMDLFPNWYLDHHRRHMPRREFDRCWDDFCGQVIGSALQQPACFVHRDFHSCNLLMTPSGEVGLIDYQDAVLGPVSYDFISLIWDRYISWPRAQLETWMEQYRQMLGVTIPPDRWRRYCDLMGLQRNIKVVGIFTRLYYRDDKSGYLEMIPRFYDYVIDTLRRYPEFSDIRELLEQRECAP